MKKKWLAGLAIGLFLVGVIDIASASIVNINAHTNTNTNPIVMHLDAGAYDITPIGVTDGGDYNAWNAWGGVVSLPTAGWLNSYYLSSDEFSAYNVGDGVIYASALLALDNALSTSFTLTSDSNVNFFISDSYYSDNVGGISLNVNSVPIPGAIWLLGSGLIGIVGLTARRKTK